MAKYCGKTFMSTGYVYIKRDTYNTHIHGKKQLIVRDDCIGRQSVDTHIDTLNLSPI